MLRDYQQKAIDDIRKQFALGNKRVLLHLATGGGKTHCFSYMLKSASEKGTKALMVVRGRDLVEQASARLHHENVEHGVYMANHKLYAPEKNIQICSIDTLNSRKLRPEAEFVVVDEAHLATSQSFKEFLAYYADKFILSVTATPYGDSDMTHLADVVVSPVDIKELIDAGYLVDARYFSSPNYIDLSDVKIKKGDYDEKQLSEKMSNIKFISDIVENYKNKGENRKALVFAVTIEHSKKIEREFNEAGIKAIHLDANATRDERLDVIEKLRKGDIKVITNVGIFTTGVDIPCLDCIILARPTKSVNLYIQMLGRGTRPYEGKEYFLVLDHAQAVYEHGFITMPRKIILAKKKKEKGAIPIRQCPECYAIMAAATRVCINCEHEFEVSMREDPNTLDMELKEVKDPYEKITERLVNKQRKRNYKPGWVFHQLELKFDTDTASKIYRHYVIPKHYPELKK